MDQVTRILRRMETGEATAAELLPAVYEELRRLAYGKMARERAGHTLQATALVHEAWLRLGAEKGTPWQSRSHFFGAAAEAMRRILVDHARKKQAGKRGGGLDQDQIEEATIRVEATPDELLAIHESLDRFEASSPQGAELVKMRYFIGLTMQEAASALGIKKRTAEGLWEYSRAWLRRDMRKVP
jgi:RNA polymerase sigma factor (TIGR02999 family)